MSDTTEFRRALDKVAQMEGHISFAAAGEDTRQRIYATVCTVALTLAVQPAAEASEEVPLALHAELPCGCKVKRITEPVVEYIEWCESHFTSRVGLRFASDATLQALRAQATP